jgi:hypothetical protein
MTSSALVMTLFRMEVFVLDKITFWANAPAPLTATPAPSDKPIPTPMEAAAETTLIVA